MYIFFDIKPETRYTGVSKQFPDRSYYYLSLPPVQFVTRGFTWESISLGDVYDANVSDDRPHIFVASDSPSVAVTKITLRRLVEFQPNAVPLSRLLLQLYGESANGTFVELTDAEKDKLSAISPYPSHAIKVLISQL